MAGGSWERVMGFMTAQGFSNEPSIGTNEVYNTGFNGKFSDGTVYTKGIRGLPDRKYYDLYIYGITYNDQEAYNRCKIGDLIRELNPVSEKSWNDDYAIFVYSDNPVLGRGGYSLSSNFGNNAGVFALSYGVGTPNDSYSFRPVLMLL